MKAQVLGLLLPSGEMCIVFQLLTQAWSTPNQDGHLGSETAVGNFFRLHSYCVPVFLISLICQRVVVPVSF